MNKSQITIYVIPWRRGNINKPYSSSRKVLIFFINKKNNKIYKIKR